MLTTFSRSPARSPPSVEVGDVHLWFTNVHGELHNLIHATVTKIYPLTGEYDEAPWNRVYYGGIDHPGMLKGVRSFRRGSDGLFRDVTNGERTDTQRANRPVRYCERMRAGDISVCTDNRIQVRLKWLKV